MGFEPEIYKKLSDNALLIGYYSNVECSQTIELAVLTPFNNTYPNLRISVLSDFSKDPTVLSAQKNAEDNKADVCDLRTAYESIADRIQAGSYSEEINNNIETAKLIAGSFKVTK